MGKRLQNITDSIEELNPENILKDWMKAVSAFQYHYSQMTDLVTACRRGRQSTAMTPLGLGQCSIKQLEHLLKSMEQELIHLLKDMNQPSQGHSRRDHQRLVAHTQSLHQLNEQAQKLLVLTILSAS